MRAKHVYDKKLEEADNKQRTPNDGQRTQRNEHLPPMKRRLNHNEHSKSNKK